MAYSHFEAHQSQNRGQISMSIFNIIVVMLKNFDTLILIEMMIPINPKTDCFNELIFFLKLENKCVVTLNFTLWIANQNGSAINITLFQD